MAKYTVVACKALSSYSWTEQLAHSVPPHTSMRLLIVKLHMNYFSGGMHRGCVPIVTLLLGPVAGGVTVSTTRTSTAPTKSEIIDKIMTKKLHCT